MTCLKYEYIRTDADGVRWYRMIVVSATEPDFDGIDPADITGLPTPAGIAAGSVFLYPDNDGNGTYKIAYEDITQNGPGPDPEEDEVMVINLTFDSAANTLTMDKTVAEIDAAMTAGKIARTTSDLSDDTATARYYGYVCEALVSTAGGGEVRIITTDMESTPTSKMNTVDIKFEQAAGEGQYPVYQMA